MDLLTQGCFNTSFVQIIYKISVITINLILALKRIAIYTFQYKAETLMYKNKTVCQDQQILTM